MLGFDVNVSNYFVIYTNYYKKYKITAICCNGAVRLASSTQSVDSVFGRVDVCVNGTWGTICSDFWENIDASIVCKQLGYTEYGLLILACTNLYYNENLTTSPVAA
jgi:deleted-in-malignant-brain-tumors protein 1